MKYNIRETPAQFIVLPGRDYDFQLKGDPTGYFGPFHGIAEQYSQKIARLELKQGTGIKGLWEKLNHPIEAKFSSRNKSVQQIIEEKRLFNIDQLWTADLGASNYFPDQAYLMSFLNLLGDGQELMYSHTELLSLMSQVYEINKT